MISRKADQKWNSPVGNELVLIWDAILSWTPKSPFFFFKGNSLLAKNRHIMGKTVSFQQRSLAYTNTMINVNFINDETHSYHGYMMGCNEKDTSFLW